MPSGKIAKIKTVEGWPQAPVRARQARRRLFRRHHARPRIVRRTRRRHRPCRPRAARGAAAARAHLLAARPAADDGRDADRAARHRRPAPPSRPSRRRSIPANSSSVGTKAVARNNVGEIELALAQPVAADPYSENPRLGRLVLEVGGRIAGGGLVLAVEGGRSAIRSTSCRSRSALRAEEKAARFRHKGAVVWFTGLPGAGKSTLARALERTLFAAAVRRCCSTATRCARGSTAISASPPKDRSENIRRSRKSPRISRAPATSRSSPRSRRRAEDRAQARRIAAEHFREVYVSTPAEVCESRDPKGHYAKARAGQLAGFTGSTAATRRPTAPNSQSTTASWRLLMRPTRSSACSRSVAPCSRNWPTSPPTSERRRPFLAAAAGR